MKPFEKYLLKVFFEKFLARYFSSISQKLPKLILKITLPQLLDFRWIGLKSYTGLTDSESAAMVMQFDPCFLDGCTGVTRRV
jgi:hypothetical protein